MASFETVDRTLECLTHQKEATGLTYAQLAKLLDRSEVWIAAVMLGKARPDLQEWDALCAALAVPSLQYPWWRSTPFMRKIDLALEKDPFLHRLYEMVDVYGLPIKACVQERLGVGIPSAVDCRVSLDFTPEGRVVLTYDSKFLGYKSF